jgi:hypothetical protein
MAKTSTRRRTPASRRTQTETPPRLSKAIRQQAEIWTDFFTLAMEKLLEESRGASANAEAVRVAGDVADVALETYEKRWPGVYL